MTLGDSVTFKRRLNHYRILLKEQIYVKLMIFTESHETHTFSEILMFHGKVRKV